MSAISWIGVYGERRAMNTATFLFGMSNHSEETTDPFRFENP